jgi:hypothetical protein
VTDEYPTSMLVAAVAVKVLLSTYDSYTNGPGPQDVAFALVGSDPLAYVKFQDTV